jgi:glutamate racemase
MTERIAVLDWGIGGLGVWRALRRRTLAPTLYLSDSGAPPYGRLPARELSQRLEAVCRHVVERGATSIVVACNAASTALDAAFLRRLPVPVIGMIEPALGLARAHPGYFFGVVGGARTIRSAVYRRGLLRAGRRVIQRVAQPLSAHIEAGTTETRRCAADLDRILAPLASVDAVLLACTHYPAIRGSIAERLPGVTLLDPAEAVAERVLESALVPPPGAADVFLTTGDPRAFERGAKRAWGLEVECPAVARP